MNGSIDTPPVSPPEFQVEGKWKVTNGSLWVKNGAILPDICLYGSAPGRLKRESVKVPWIPRAANVLNWILALLGTCVLLGYSWTMRPGLSEMMQALLIAALASSAIQTMAFKKNWKRRRITIQRSKGWRAVLRVTAAVCALFAIFNVVLVGLDHYLELAGYDQEQKLGIVNSLFFFWIVSMHAVILFQLVRAVETRDGWHRLAGIHPRALAELSRIQGQPPT